MTNQPYYQAYQQPVPEQPSTQVKNPNKKRNLYIGIGVGVAVLLCCCLSLVLVLVVDPFGWGLLSRFTGGVDSPAKAVPADAEIYLGVNLLNLTPEKIDRVLIPFSDALEDINVYDYESAIKEMDKQLDDALDLTITDDVMPWIGQYVGVGIYDIETDSYGDMENGSLIFAIEARNTKGADEFLVKLRDGFEKNQDSSFDESEYEGVSIFVSEEYPEIAFGRSKNLVLISNTEDALHEAIDAQQGDSMAKNADYKAMLKELPKERAIHAYFQNLDFLDALSSGMSMGMNTGGMFASALDGWKSSMLSLAIVDAGVQMDMVSGYDTEILDEDMKAMLETAGTESKTLAMMPEETLVFVSGTHLDLAWKAINVSLAGMGDEVGYKESMDQFEEMAGFNLDDDLMAYLDGDYSIAVFPSKDGFLSEMQGVDLGIVGMVGTSQQDPLMDTLDKLADTMEENYMTVDTSSVGDGQIYEVQDVGFSFGLSDSYLGLGTSANSLEDVFAVSTSFKDNPRYQEMKNAVPSGMSPVIFVDFAGGLEYVEELISYSGDDATMNALKPIEYLVASGSSLKGNLMRSSFLLAIEPVK